MTIRRYVVEAHAAHASTRWRRPYWTVDVGGEVDGDFAGERAALLVAIDAAQRDGLRGIKGEVAVRSDRGGESIVWVFGRDFYPPRFSPAEPSGRGKPDGPTESVGAGLLGAAQRFLRRRT
jgi:hypothetical protein